MKQRATVKDVMGDTAHLLIKRQTMCDGCHRESGCGRCSQVIEIKVKNTLHASVGDTVEIETPGASVIGVAALVFLLPLLLSFAAYFVFELLGAKEWMSYLGAVIAPVLCYAVIAIAVRKSKKTLSVIMTDIVITTNKTSS